ncbi:hypothetical protein, partial [Xenorhabdus innexi]
LAVFTHPRLYLHKNTVINTSEKFLSPQTNSQQAKQKIEKCSYTYGVHLAVLVYKNHLDKND